MREPVDERTSTAEPSSLALPRLAPHKDAVWMWIGEQLIVGQIPRLKTRLERLIIPARRFLIADFLECEYIDSAALGLLFSVHKKLKRRAGGVIVQNLNDDLKTLFELTRLDREFQVAADPRLPAKALVALPKFHEVNRELLEYFSRHPDRLSSDLDWREFEQLLEAVFRNQGFRTELGSGRADGGIDMRLLQSDSCGEILTLVQVKRYAPSRAIRLEAIQAFGAVVDDCKANRGVFVTTSRYLPSAKRFAERHGRRLTLADSVDVSKWCAEIVRRGVL